MRVQNVRGGKIGVTENTESGICFKTRHIQYTSVLQQMGVKGGKSDCIKEKRAKGVGSIILWVYVKKG